MRKKKTSPKNYNVDLMQPDEVNALKDLVVEYVRKMQTIEQEIQTLNEDKAALTEEYSQKLDIKSLKVALQIVKAQSSVVHHDTVSLFIEALKDPTL